MSQYSTHQLSASFNQPVLVLFLRWSSHLWYLPLNLRNLLATCLLLHTTTRILASLSSDYLLLKFRIHVGGFVNTMWQWRVFHRATRRHHPLHPHLSRSPSAQEQGRIISIPKTAHHRSILREALIGTADHRTDAVWAWSWTLSSYSRSKNFRVAVALWTRSESHIHCVRYQFFVSYLSSSSLPLREECTIIETNVILSIVQCVYYVLLPLSFACTSSSYPHRSHLFFCVLYFLSIVDLSFLTSWLMWEVPCFLLPGGLESWHLAADEPLIWIHSILQNVSLCLFLHSSLPCVILHIIADQNDIVLT